MTKKYMPRVMIAAVSSGSGKTMITCGLLNILKKTMHPVAYKCGPDYIDPMFHKFVLDIPSRNLDTFFTDTLTTRTLMGSAFDAAKADIAVVEGVMGYYDGLGGISTVGSSYDLSVKTETPVVLVVNGRGMSLSIVAVIRGFMQMYPDQMIRGVILNRVSPMICARLQSIIERELGVVVVGCVPETEAIAFPSRHLGLIMPEELSQLREQIEQFSNLLVKTIDMEKLLTIARGAKDICCEADNQYLQPYQQAQPIKIGIAKDEAFCFYYEDNLQLLRELGGELVEFSPMYDKKLPEGLAGIYMGGGYPELYAEILSKNQAMHQAIREAVNQGMPVLAECGAFMYLHEEMEDANGKFWQMVGLVPAKAVRKQRLVRFGYAEMTAKTDSILGKAGLTLPSHEFHYWDTTMEGGCFEGSKPLADRQWQCMYQYKNLLTGFPHFYFYGNRQAAVHYMDTCRDFDYSQH